MHAYTYVYVTIVSGGEGAIIFKEREEVLGVRKRKRETKRKI